MFNWTNVTNISFNTTPIPPVCASGLTVTTKQQLESLIYTDFFNQIINRLYWFVIISLFLSLIIYRKQIKYYMKQNNKTKLVYIINLFMQMGTYIFISYLKFLIFYNWLSLGFFFIMLLPFFYILNIYSLPITETIIDKIDIKGFNK